jgi:multisubunit Na+/H+ antiporter MnhB subunit
MRPAEIAARHVGLIAVQQSRINKASREAVADDPGGSMFEFVALTYGVIASFIMASASRNRRERRRNPPLLVLFGLMLMGLSAAMGVLLLGYAGYQVLSGAPAIV